MHESYKKWLEDGKPKVICSCGCNKEIIIKPHHKYSGVPKYIIHHGNYSLETIEKIRLSNSGENNYWFGKHLSEEHKQKISENHADLSGENHPMYGKQHTEEAKQKISESAMGRIPWNKGKKGHLSQETLKLISDSGKGRIPWNKGKHPPEETRKKQSESHIGLQCGENSPNWKGGISFEPYCPKFNNRKKEEIRNKYNRKCCVCGKDEKDNLTKKGEMKRLSIHHIDEDKEQGCNGKGWKLVPLCLQCHRKIHNNKKIKENLC